MSPANSFLTRRTALAATAGAVTLLPSAARAAETSAAGVGSSRPVAYRTVKIDGLPIFYREAGDPNAPVLLLLHGLPSSSRMYEPLLARLADKYRLIAPDYPGFGHSAAPALADFAYTFDHLADVLI